MSLATSLSWSKPPWQPAQKLSITSTSIQSLDSPGDHLLIGMTSFPHSPTRYVCLYHLKAVPDQTPAISWIPNYCHISILFPPSPYPRKKTEIQAPPVEGNSGHKGKWLKSCSSSCSYWLNLCERWVASCVVSPVSYLFQTHLKLISEIRF